MFFGTRKFPGLLSCRRRTACIALENWKLTYNFKKDTGVLVINKWYSNFSVVKKINRYTVYGFILVPVVELIMKRPSALSIFLA